MKLRKGICLILIVAMLILQSFAVIAAVDTDRRTVRVGFLVDSPYMMQRDENTGVMTGYAYEYLQEVAKYANWDYVYVDGEWNELWHKLMTGQIDIMVDVSHTTEREELIIYPKTAMGRETYKLYALETDETINSVNIRRFMQSKRIGVRADTIQEGILTDWVKSQALNCLIKSYKTNEDRDADLEKGKIDMVLEVDTSASTEWEPILELGSSDYYVGIAKGQTAIADEFNTAIDCIEAVNPQFINNLYYKYFTKENISSHLTEIEQEWVKNHNTIICGYTAQQSLLYEKTEPMLDDLLTTILHGINIKEVNVETREYETYGDMKEALNEGEIDIIYPVYNNPYAAEQEGVKLLDPINTMSVSILLNKNMNIEDAETLGVFDDAMAEYFAEVVYPGKTYYPYTSEHEALEAVASGKIDAAFVDGDIMESKISSSRRYSDLSVIKSAKEYESALGVGENNVGLYMLLKRGFNQAGDSYISEITAKYNKVESSYTLSNAIKNNLGAIVFGLLVTVFIIILLIQRANVRKTQMLIKLSETDSLTGILNRSGEEKVKALIEARTSGMFIVLDVDKFKTINDSYGHEIGDKALIAVAQVLEKVFRGNDIILRLGGDEFAVFVVGVDNEETAVNIFTYLFDMIDAISIPEIKQKQIQISVGATFYDGREQDDFDAIYKRADEGCYESKKIVGNKFSFVKV